MQLLTRHAGMWAGTNRFRLMPDDPAAEASATAQLSLGAGGNLAVLAYTWRHPDDGAQDGLLVLGPDEAPGGVVALWGDSWHQKPAAKQLRGAIGRNSPCSAVACLIAGFLLALRQPDELFDVHVAVPPGWGSGR